MPAESAIAAARIVLAVAKFAIALAWADFQIRIISPPPGPAE